MIKAKFKMPALLSNGHWASIQREVARMVNACEINPDAGYMLYLTDGRPVRTRSQNNYYWGVIVKTFADAVGMESDEVHDIWKRMFAGYRMMEFPGGKKRRVANSTASMSKNNMSLYIEKCIMFCAENGIVIPSPDAIPDGKYMSLVADGTMKA